VTLLAFAAERRAAALWCCAGAGRLAAAAVDRCILPVRRSAANPATPRLWSNDGTDRRTDGRTLGRFIEPALRTMRAV